MASVRLCPRACRPSHLLLQGGDTLREYVRQWRFADVSRGCPTQNSRCIRRATTIHFVPYTLPFTAAHLLCRTPPPSPVGMLLRGQRQQLASFSGGGGRGRGVCAWRRRPKYLLVGAAVGETVFVVKQQDYQPLSPSATVSNPRSSGVQQ